MTKPSYEELERLAKAATEGEWKARRREGLLSFVEARPDSIVKKYGYGIEILQHDDNEKTYPKREADVDYIAAANPQAILALLSDLARVRGLLQRIVSAHTLYNNRLTGETMAILADTIREAAESSLSQANGDSLVTTEVVSSPVGTKAERQWISVEERLPESCGNYLTAGTMFTDETIGKHVAELSWDGSEWRELRDLLPMGTFGSKITHWRELPEPPSGAESADIGKLDTADKSGKVNRVDAMMDAERFWDTWWAQKKASGVTDGVLRYTANVAVDFATAYHERALQISGVDPAPTNSETTVSPDAACNRENTKQQLSTAAELKSVEYSSQNQTAGSAETGGEKA